MNGRMKVMIGYDGSSCADAAIDDLRSAGLPRDSEVLVVSAADLSAVIPPVSEYDLHSLVSRRVDAVLRSVKGCRAQVLKEAENLALKAVDRLRGRFPEWKVRHEILQGKPAAELLLRKAVEWQPDLIVVGSQGRSAIGRFFLGSVSKKIAEDAACAVRIARRGFEKTQDAPTKIIAGASTLPNAERIIESIGRRVWADETKVRLVKIDDGVSPDRISAVYPYAKAILEQSAERLAAIGLQVSVDIRSGSLKPALLEEAENWKADAIFIAAGGANNLSDLGETAASMVTDAACTVEIVR